MLYTRTKIIAIILPKEPFEELWERELKHHYTATFAQYQEVALQQIKNIYETWFTNIVAFHAGADKLEEGAGFQVGMPLATDDATKKKLRYIVESFRRIIPNQWFYPEAFQHVTMAGIQRIVEKEPSLMKSINHEAYNQILNKIVFSSFQLHLYKILPSGVIVWEPNPYSNPEALFDIRRQLFKEMHRAKYENGLGFDMTTEGDPKVFPLIHSSLWLNYDIKEIWNNRDNLVTMTNRLNAEIEANTLLIMISIDSIKRLNEAVNNEKRRELLQFEKMNLALYDEFHTLKVGETKACIRIPLREPSTPR